jgi:hypothetical protein
MKVLTVKADYATAIFTMGKDIENRTWRTPYRGPIAIHAASRYSKTSARELELECEELDVIKGHIIGIVDLVNINKSWCASTWGERGYHHWHLANPRLLADPFRVKGHLGLWTPDASTLRKLLKADVR